MKTIILGIITILLWSCSSSTGPGLGEEIDLRFGQTRQISGENLSVKFVSVEEDSRCPIGAECIWEGNAEILLQIFLQTFSLNTSLEPKEINIEGYHIDLLSVSPVPREDLIIQEEDYVIRLVITR